jgi:hypothetical protein
MKGMQQVAAIAEEDKEAKQANTCGERCTLTELLKTDPAAKK